MLKFDRLTLANFGAYKNTEIVDFPLGVSIVYGENMRGKTTLLNGFRFALFGTVLTRSMRPLPYRDLVNWESAASGNHSATVELCFSHDEHEYVLTRTLQAREGLETPYHDSDYVQHCFLVRDGEIMSDAQTRHQLAIIMPEQISRFFLFDGELLQQYEELLRQESRMGQEISEAIEQILGVPVLKKARSILDTLVKDAQVTEGAAARQNKATALLGLTYSQLQAERHQLAGERERYLSDQTDLLARQRAAEEVLQRSQQAAALMDEMRKLEGDLKGLRTQVATLQAGLRTEMAEAWKWLALPRVKVTLDRVQKDLIRARDSQMEVVWGKKLLDVLQASIVMGECKACGQILDAAAIERIAVEIESMQTATAPFDPTAVQRLTKVAEALKPFQGPERLAIVEALRTQIDGIHVEITDKKSRIDEIRSEEMTKLKQQEILDARQELQVSTKELGIVELQIKHLNEQISKKDAEITKAQSQLENAAGSDEKLAKEQHKRALLQTLHGLLEEGVKLYRHRLRERVEADASELFRSMTSERQYKGLSINEHYGLTIMHEDGTPVPVRSSGAEHVVALSLMGALQRNAPMRGPVIMDSPFGRLDDTHKSNIVKALPIIADQVMLLVFEAELAPKMARALLPENLKAEYSLERVSARHTQIRKV